MAHEIYIDGDTISMMYAGDVPWHGLGTRLDGPATAAEAIQAANLDWKVTKLDLFGTNGVLGVPVRGKYAVVREDKIGQPDAEALGIVSGSYSLLQNVDAFSFFDTIVKDQGAAIYHTAGALGKGERVWILAKLPSDIIVAGNDVTHKYLLLSNSHDGSGSVQIKFTPVRVVCNNTLTMALSSGEGLRFPHYRDLQERLSNAHTMLRLIHTRFDEMEKDFNGMAEVRIDSQRLLEYLRLVFPDPPNNLESTRAKKIEEKRKLAAHFFSQGAGNDAVGVQGTLWAAYNGVTEMVDHQVQSLDRKTVITGASTRLNSIWFGTGAKTKEHAYNIAIEKLNEWSS